MSKKTLIILWAVAAALLVTIIAIKLTDKPVLEKPTELSSGAAIFKDLKADGITSLTLTQGENKTQLTRKENGWVVEDRDDYPADFTGIASILRVLPEIKVIQAIHADAKYDERFGFKSDEGIKIDLKDDSGSTAYSISVGKSPDTKSRRQNISRYIRVSTHPSDVYIVDGSFANFETKPSAWLKNDFFRVDEIKTISTDDWSVTRDNIASDLISTEGKVPHPNYKTRISGLLSAANFIDVLPKDIKPKENAKTATITTFDNYTYTLTLWKEEGNTIALKADISADFPTELKTTEGESDEQKATAEAAFKKQLEQNQKNLAEKQSYTERAYTLPKNALEVLLKGKEEVFAPKEPASTTPRSATTPPIAIPGLGG